MNLLGDFGGFNDGLMIFPSAIMGVYGSYFFTRMVAKEVPVKKRRNKKKQSALYNSLAQREHSELNPVEIDELHEETSLVVRTELFSLKSFCRPFSKKTKEKLLRKKALERVDHQLDIRSIFAMYTNLALLQDVLLNKEQKLLFAN